MLTRVIIYTKHLDEMVAFYCSHFGFVRRDVPGDRIIELVHPDGGSALMLHAAARPQKMGQALVKLAFDVADVAARRAELLAEGVAVGTMHDGGGYHFANLKDPSGNSVQITSRGSAPASGQ